MMEDTMLYAINQPLPPGLTRQEDQRCSNRRAVMIGHGTLLHGALSSQSSHTMVMLQT